MSKAKRAQGRLTGDQKRYVVQLLAEFQTPGEIAAAFKEQFGRTITIQGVCHYRDSAKWAPEIERAREALLSAVRSLPMASKYWRLKELGRLYEEADKARKVRSVRVGSQVDGDRTVAQYERVEEKDFRTLAVLLRQAGEELGQLRKPVDDQPYGRPRVVRLGGRTVSGAVAGLPDTGPGE